jgi:hypothetical protein
MGRLSIITLKPAFISAQTRDGSPLFWGTPEVRIRLIRRKDVKKVAESMMNAGANVEPTAARIPAAAVPKRLKTIREVWDTELAASSFSLPTTAGRNAARAGLKTVPMAAWTKAMA